MFVMLWEAVMAGAGGCLPGPRTVVTAMGCGTLAPFVELFFFGFDTLGRGTVPTPSLLDVENIPELPGACAAVRCTAFAAICLTGTAGGMLPVADAVISAFVSLSSAVQ